MQICLETLEHQVQIFSVLRLYDPLQLYYVLMLQLPQHTHLSVGPLRIDLVLKRVEDLLQGVLTVCGPVGHLPDLSVGAGTQVLLDLEMLKDVGL